MSAGACRGLDLETMSLEQSGRVLTARYSDPPMNYVTFGFIRDLDRLTRAADRDKSVGAVVLTGAGERFLTHADPGVLGALIKAPHPVLSARAIEPGLRLVNAALRLPGLVGWVDRHGGVLGRSLAWGHRWKRSILRMNRSSTVYLAAMNGPTMGGGLEIALACDLRFVADAEHVRIAQFEVVVGLIPGGGGTQRLARILGTASALEHILEGRPLTAVEALEAGIVHGLSAPEDLLAATQATAARLAARSPVSVGAVKRSIYFGTDRPFSRGLDLELAGFLAAGSVRSARETLKAFMSDLDRDGETPLLADPEPWLAGTRVDRPPERGGGGRPAAAREAGVIFAAVARPRVHDLDGVLDAAEEIVAEGGGSALTIRSLAARTKAPSGSLYHAFGSRNEMMGRLWLRGATRFLDVQREAIAEHLGPDGGSDQAVEATVAVALAPVALRDRVPRTAHLLFAHRREDIIEEGLPTELAEELAALDDQLLAILRQLAAALFGRRDRRSVEVVALCVVDLPTIVLRSARPRVIDEAVALEAAVRGVLADSEAIRG